MKKLIWIACSALSLCYAEESDRFRYFSMGVSEPAYGSYKAAPELSFGRRVLDGRNGYDFVLGTQINHRHQALYGQAAYLFYPFAPNKLYLGAGLRASLGHFYDKGVAPVATIPLILGFQYSAGERRHFIQVDQGMESSWLDSRIAVRYGMEF